jgi:hypothetical protein
MRTLKYAVLGVASISLIFSSLSLTSYKFRLPQKEALTFCETYTQKEVISNLDSKDTFFTWVRMEGTDPESSRIGTCQEADLKLMWNYIQGEAFRSQLPADLIIALGAEASGTMIPLYAIRKPASNDLFPSQKDIDEVSVSSGNEDNYALLISFSATGAINWASMTRKNVGRNIAILYDGKVLAAPRVTEEIKGGKCIISGKYTEVEINKLKAAFE